MNAGGGPAVSVTGGRHGAVAATIHGGVRNNYYQVARDASPAAKFAYARDCLDSGQATTARSLLAEVVVRRRDSTEVWFHWLLAFFSGRTLAQLSPQDHEMLAQAQGRIDGLPRDAWSPGIDVIRRLAGAGAGEDPEAVVADIDALDAGRRAQVLRHLERVLHGSLKDGLWEREVEQARTGRHAERRRERAWMFFEPDPAPPRTRPVRPADRTAAPVVLFLAVVAAGAAAVLARLALLRQDDSAVIALVVALAGAVVALTNGTEWRYRADGARARQPVVHPRGSGEFTGRVDGFYERYARKYAPRGANREVWFLEVDAEIRRLRDEVCEVYREQRIDADRVKWLVRFQMRELRRQWNSGELPGGRPPVTWVLRAATAAGAVVAVAFVLWAVQAAALQDLLQAAAALAVLAVAAVVGVRLHLRLGADHRRYAAEEAEREARETSYWFEFQRWQQRLADRPDDMQMGRWLDCDRRLLVQHALTAYQLKWSDVRAYASTETRAGRSRRARAKNGPWRYARYRVLVFLLTGDGVRQITVELDFAQATLHLWERMNYRYDAVAAVRVSLLDDGARDFRLFLVDGQTVPIEVSEPWSAEDDEDARVIADGEQDATGLRNTLFVLEGVAAEGRGWWTGPASRRAG